MAEDTANDISYWLELNLQHKHFLGQIRHWDNLKMATNETSIWVKDFTATQLEATELKSIPFANLYYSKDHLLFPKGSLLPSRKLPSFLWTPIERALPLELTGLNHNFFGLVQQQLVKLVATEEEQKATILLTDIDSAEQYIQTAAAIRLQSLKWLLVNEREVLIFGEPMLPLDGKVFWQQQAFIFPVGYRLEFTILEKTVAQKIDPDAKQLIWWMDEQHYCLLDPGQLQSLSIASWRQTMQAMNNQLQQ